MVFLEKNIELKKVRGKVDFLQIRHFFIAEMGKASSESWGKPVEESYCTVKTFSCNR